MRSATSRGLRESQGGCGCARSERIHASPGNMQEADCLRHAWIQCSLAIRCTSLSSMCLHIARGRLKTADWGAGSMSLQLLSSSRGVSRALSQIVSTPDVLVYGVYAGSRCPLDHEVRTCSMMSDGGVCLGGLLRPLSFSQSYIDNMTSHSAGVAVNGVPG